MTLSHRIFSKESDYELVCQWWKHFGWPVLEADLLGFGVMVESGGTPTAVGWVYPTGTAWAELEFIVVNPTVPMKRRHQAVKYLIERLKIEARQFGARVLYSQTESKGLIKVFKKAGFSIGDTNLTSLVMNLWE